MKRILPLLTAILFSLVSLSCAEAPLLQTRTESIFLEGVEETITTTRIETYRGYSWWIDTDYLTLIPEVEGLGMDLFRRPDTEDNRYEVAIYYGGWLGYTFEEDAEITLQNMLDNYANAEEFDIDRTFADLPARGFCATEGDMTFLHYVVDVGEGAYHIGISFPQEAAEGFGSRVIQMLRSFEVFAIPD